MKTIALLSLLLLLSCQKEPTYPIHIIDQERVDVSEREAVDFTSIDTLKGEELKIFLTDRSKYYRIITWGSLDGQNYYSIDTISITHKQP